MVEAVLDYAVEQVIEIVVAAGHGVLESGIGEIRDSLAKLLGAFEEMRFGLRPCHWIVVSDGRSIAVRANQLWHHAALGCLESGVHPSIDVQNQFPNGVSRLQRPGESLVGRDI